MLSTMFAGIFFLLCAFACMKDLSSLTIPNWVNAGIALLFFPAALFVDISLATFGWHLLVGLIAFVICFFLFSVGAFGGGDAKMIPAVALWMGPPAIFPFLVYTAIFGGVLALAVLGARNSIPAAFAPGFVRATMEEGNGVPYGVAISLGALIAGSSTPFLTSFLSIFSQLN